jgi:hypothetical protein
MCRFESTAILTSGGKTDRDDVGEASPQIEGTRTGGLQPLGAGSGAVASCGALAQYPSSLEGERAMGRMS